MVGGLSDFDLQIILKALERFPNIERALLFGSRAKGNFQPGSDVDIALIGKELGNAATCIGGTLNDQSPLPYYFDILWYDQITRQDLRDHIDRVGIPIYQRS